VTFKLGVYKKITGICNFITRLLTRHLQLCVFSTQLSHLVARFGIFCLVSERNRLYVLN